MIVANKLDALAPAQRDQALRLIRATVEESLPDARCGAEQGEAMLSFMPPWHGTKPLRGALLTSLTHTRTCIRSPTALQRPAHRGPVGADRQRRRAAAAHGPHAVRALEQARADLKAEPMGGAGALRCAVECCPCSATLGCDLKAGASLL